MPKTRRSYKSRKPRRANRKKKKSRAKSRYQKRTPKFKTLNSLYRTPSAYQNQTIQKTVESSSLSNTRLYEQPSAFVPSKFNNVTNLLYQFTSLDPGQTINLQQCFQTTTQVVPEAIPEFRRLVETFRYIRFKWIKVTLIPHMYEAAGPQTGQPEYPLLHYINDDGSASLGLGQQSNYPISACEALPDSQYGKVLFTKPVTFTINPVEKLTPSKASPNYASYRRWIDTTTGGLGDEGTVYIPNDSFYFGFTDIPTGWKFQTRIEACIVAKEIILN